MQSDSMSSKGLDGCMSVLNKDRDARRVVCGARRGWLGVLTAAEVACTNAGKICAVAHMHRKEKQTLSVSLSKH